MTLTVVWSTRCRVIWHWWGEQYAQRWQVPNPPAQSAARNRREDWQKELKTFIHVNIMYSDCTVYATLHFGWPNVFFAQHSLRLKKKYFCHVFPCSILFLIWIFLHVRCARHQRVYIVPVFAVHWRRCRRCFAAVPAVGATNAYVIQPSNYARIFCGLLLLLDQDQLQDLFIFSYYTAR